MSIRPGLAAVVALFGTIALAAQGTVSVSPPGAPPVTTQTSSAQAKGNGLITGRVVDAAGAPIAAAVVAVSGGSIPARGSGPGTPPRVITDNDGRFFFGELAAGSYTISTTKPGLLPGAFGRRRPGGSSVPVDLTEDGRRGDITITMWPAAVISGRVIDDNGDPLVNAEVRAVPQAVISGRRQSGTPIREKTDDRGAYRFSGLVPGNYIIVAPVVVISEPATLAGAARAGTLPMRSYYQTMAAVGSAPLIFSGRADGISGNEKTLIGSWAALPGMPAGDAPWHTYPTTFFPSTTSLTAASVVRVAAGQERSGTDLVVRLTQTFKVSGTLTNPDSSVAAYHAVHLLDAASADTPLFDVATAVSDGDGAFTFYGVPRGQYIARVVRVPYPTGGLEMGVAGGTGAIPYIATFGSMSRGPNQPFASSAEPLVYVSQPVGVADRHVTGLALTLRTGVRITGRAEFEGQAARPTPEQLRGMRVNLEPANGQQYYNVLPGVLTDDGQFATPSMWPGRYLIQVGNAPPGWTFRGATHQGHDVADTPVDLSGDLENVVLSFTDRPASVNGSVQSTDGQPVAGAAVLMFPVDPARWVDNGRSARRVRLVSASGSGAFRITAPPAGEYFLVAIPDEQSVDWQEPATLRKLSGIAVRIQVRDSATTTQALMLQKIQ